MQEVIMTDIFLSITGRQPALVRLLLLIILFTLLTRPLSLNDKTAWQA
jgi:hypothetical protein